MLLSPTVTPLTIIRSAGDDLPKVGKSSPARREDISRVRRDHQPKDRRTREQNEDKSALEMDEGMNDVLHQFTMRGDGKSSGSIIGINTERHDGAVVKEIDGVGTQTDGDGVGDERQRLRAARRSASLRCGFPVGVMGKVSTGM